MTAKKIRTLPEKGPGPAQAPQQEGAAAAPPPHEIRHKTSRPRLSGEGAEAALLHLIEREKLRIVDYKLP